MKRSALFLTTLLASLSLGVAAQGTGGSAAAGDNGTSGGTTGTGSEASAQQSGSAGASTDSDQGTTPMSGGGSSAGATTNFRDLDINQDNSLDQDEARQGGMERDFRLMDSNRDDSVDENEYNAWSQNQGN